MSEKIKTIKWLDGLLAFVAVVIVLLGGLSLIATKKISTAGPNSWTKSTLRSLSVALVAYQVDYNLFPPSNEDNGGEEEGTRFKYRNDILVKYLDGDPSNGGGNIKYFDFEKDKLRGENGLIYVDTFGEPFWYCNFQQQYIENPKTHQSKVLNPKAIYHPWTNRVHPRSFQIYSKVQFPENPYGSKEKTKDNFKWITNYN